MKNKLHTIPAHLPFADTLAHWVLSHFGAEPHKLPGILILLPSRRACLSLREAFLRATDGKPLLLPRMQPLGDVPDELLLSAPLASLPTELLPPSPGFEYKRLFILAHLIRNQRERTTGHKEPLDHAMRLAAELAHLLDETEREQVTLTGLLSLVPERFAAHWQETVEFLKILSEHWPRIAEEEGIISPETYRANMLGALAEHWRTTMPTMPVIAAGTTGSIPATADLLSAIATLPEGRIILPGLDTDAGDSYFKALDESHPQWGMQQLLIKLKCNRKDVSIIGMPMQSPRVALLSEIMRPAETSDAWQGIALDPAKALSGMKQIICASVQEEASIIALLLREALETKAKTAALVTHDRALARRVVAIMLRFGVSIDDSAGMPLAETPAATFLRLILETLASDFAPVPLLSLLKHPFTHAGMPRIACLEAARELERICLRGLRISGGLAGILQSLALHTHVPPDVTALIHHLQICFAPLIAVFSDAKTAVPLAVLLTTHLQCAEALGNENLWGGDEGEAVTALLSQLQTVAAEASITAIEADSYPALFETFFAGKVLRPPYGMHPRLKILSPIEARMQSFDRIILGGLNEGSWPPAITGDAWLNRPMRVSIKLPAPERRIGLAAHDFFMLAAGSEVYLTRAEKVDGVPTTPARWLVTLDVLLNKLAARHMLADDRPRQWARLLDKPEHIHACQPPAPTPPLSARPREISVTQVETWLRDPYSLYASKILKLKKLHALGQDPTGRDFGDAVHKALEQFVRAYPSTLPEDAYEQLLECGRKELQPLFFNAVVEALWWPRFMRIATFVIDQERNRRHHLRRVLTEIDGTYRLGDFTLTGRADRIEEATDGSLGIVDYKTGALPATKDIEEGLASQLILLALIAEDGAMAVRGPAEHLEYWQLQGGHDAGKIKRVDEAKIDLFIEAALKGLKDLIRTYDNPDFPYRATPIPARARRYNDYDHLARTKEWS